jgi:hypothetical protein
LGCQKINGINPRSATRQQQQISKEYGWCCRVFNFQEDLLRSLRLHRALSRDPKIKLGSLVAPSGRHTQSEGKTSELLLTTHFPNSEVTQELAAFSAGRSDWRLAVRVITYRRVDWAIDSFAPYKSPGIYGIFPALLQEGQEVVIAYLVRIFCAFLSTGYLPVVW